MINFFRRIRLDLMKKKQTGKYLTYALGEIVLVVIGILIALQINNMNEQRKDRVTEQKMLAQLRGEFKSNLRQLDSKIALRINIMRQAAEVLDYMDSQKEVPVDTLIQKISAILLTPTFDPIQNELFNSERLQLIQNDTLRKYLSNWPSSVADLKEGENEMVLIYNNIIIPFLIDFGIARDANLSFYNDEKNLNYLQDKKLSRKVKLSRSRNTPSANEILNNRKLEGILSSTFLVTEGINWESEARRNQIIKIIGLIDEQIK